MKESNAIPRPEYPRPQFYRESWINLNGFWTYTFDFGQSGQAQDYHKKQGFIERICVPFCPESTLSGVEYKDFIPSMWYHRTISIPIHWQDQKIHIHFGGVDYRAEIFIDGKSAGIHYGGSSSFSADLTTLVTPGNSHNLVVYVSDNIRDLKQPSGKQSTALHSAGCSYTRVTGIWQTVWMEASAPDGLEMCQILPDLDKQQFVVIPRFFRDSSSNRFRVTCRSGDTLISQDETAACSGNVLTMPVDQCRQWGPSDPHLYDFTFETIGSAGTVKDRVESYAGMRKIHVEGNRLFLNNEPLYMRMVLDQGYYPDGIWTAPSDQALKRDIEISLRAGFNGARLHQKVFEERFHYWADKLGYLTWGESASWPIDLEKPESAYNFLAEWREIVIRDRNHPSIIAWTPFNETKIRNNPLAHNRTVSDTYFLTRDLDPSRPVNDTSGYIHVKTDLWTVHTYRQDPAALEELLKENDPEKIFRKLPDQEPSYEGQPYIVDEFGGIKWSGSLQEANDRKQSWGYGNAPESIDEFYIRLEGLVNAVQKQEHICGYCYTQLFDVEQEQNGIYRYDRSEKFDMKRIHSIFS